MHTFFDRRDNLDDEEDRLDTERFKEDDLGLCISSSWTNIHWGGPWQQKKERIKWTKYTMRDILWFDSDVQACNLHPNADTSTYKTTFLSLMVQI